MTNRMSSYRWNSCTSGDQLARWSRDGVAAWVSVRTELHPCERQMFQLECVSPDMCDRLAMIGDAYSATGWPIGGACGGRDFYFFCFSSLNCSGADDSA